MLGLFLLMHFSEGSDILTIIKRSLCPSSHGLVALPSICNGQAQPGCVLAHIICSVMTQPVQPIATCLSPSTTFGLLPGLVTKVIGSKVRFCNRFVPDRQGNVIACLDRKAPCRAAVNGQALNWP